MSDEKDETKSASVIPDPATVVDDGKGEPKAPEVKKVLPLISKKFVNKETGAAMTLVHNPNTGIYAETITTIDGKVTKTTHSGISHAWGRFEEVKK